MTAKKQQKWKYVKSFYYSTLEDNDYCEDGETLLSSRYNEEKKKANKLAKKMGGIVRTVYHDVDEGYEYRVYKKT